MASKRVVCVILAAVAAWSPAAGARAAAVEPDPAEAGATAAEPETGKAADAAADLLPPGHVASFESLDLSGKPVSTGVSVHNLVPELAPVPWFEQRRDYWQRRFIQQTVPPSPKFRLFETATVSKTELWKPLPLEVDDNAIPPHLRGHAFEDSMRFDGEEWFDPSAWKASRKPCAQLVTEVNFETPHNAETERPPGRVASMVAYVRNIASAIYYVVDGVFFGGPGSEPKVC